MTSASLKRWVMSSFGFNRPERTDFMSMVVVVVSTRRVVTEILCEHSLHALRACHVPPSTRGFTFLAVARPMHACVPGAFLLTN